MAEVSDSEVNSAPTANASPTRADLVDGLSRRGGFAVVMYDDPDTVAGKPLGDRPGDSARAPG